MGGRRDKASDSPPSSGSSDRTVQRKIPHAEEPPPPPPPRKEEGAWSQADLRAMRLRLSLIHGYYLEALSRLPTADLRTTLARGLLVAGHCYGPLHPVQIIILNSIWYTAAFPLRIEPVRTDGIARLRHRSLHGLVAFLRHCCPSLSSATDGDALYHLSLADANLPLAIASANDTSSARALAAMASLAHGANKVASEAAHHPNPDAYALFATSLLLSSSSSSPTPLLDQQVDLLRANYMLSSSDLERLSAHLLLPDPDFLPPPKLHTGFLDTLSSYKQRWKHQEQQLLLVVGMALHKYMLQTGKQFYLHVICGVSFLEEEELGRRRRCHLNFLACPNSTGDCFACETNKKNVVHPFCKQYQGGQYLGEDGTCIFLKPLDVDYIFFDAGRDNGSASLLLPVPGD